MRNSSPLCFVTSLDGALWLCPRGTRKFFDSQTFGFAFLFFAFTPSAASFHGATRTLVGLYGSVIVRSSSSTINSCSNGVARRCSEQRLNLAQRRHSNGRFSGGARPCEHSQAWAQALERTSGTRQLRNSCEDANYSTHTSANIGPRRSNIRPAVLQTG